MFGLTLFLAGLAAAAQAADAGDIFPCDKLGDGGFRIFEGIGPLAERKPAVPLRLKKGARFRRETYPLLTRWLTFDDQALATEAGKFPPMAFRAFRIDGERRYCTSMFRESVFGPRVADGNFHLRCLYDQDGDGRLDSYRAHGELVSYNMRTGKTGRPSGNTPPRRALPKPVTLIETGSTSDPNPAFAPRITEDLKVTKIGPGEVTLAAVAEVSTLPAGSGLRGVGKGRTMTVPLREGLWTSPDGRTLELSRKGSEWFALLGGEPRSTAGLQCGGSVVVTGTQFTILSEGGMSVIERRSVPAQ
jgi:hypothetical protein